MSADIRINAERLWGSLMEMAKIGATPRGGVKRLTLSDLDRQSRDLFVAWCKAAGLTVSVDGVGSIFARRAGGNNALPPVVSGSHLDTQPSGGRFDGCYGVMAALEVARTLNDRGIGCICGRAYGGGNSGRPRSGRHVVRRRPARDRLCRPGAGRRTQ